jgi:hypothetical protein
VRGYSSIHVYQFYIPFYLHAKFPTCTTHMGRCGWHKHIPKHPKHHRPCVPNGQVEAHPSPMLIALAHFSTYRVHQVGFTCLFSHYITRACGVNFHACSIHTPANQTSRIQHGIRASKPPPSPPKLSEVCHWAIFGLV